MAELVGLRLLTHDGTIFFFTRLLLEIQLNEKAGPILFEFLRGLHTFEETTGRSWLFNCRRTVGPETEAASVPLFPFVKRRNIHPTDITGRPRNGQHVAQFLLHSRDQIVLLKGK